MKEKLMECVKKTLEILEKKDLAGDVYGIRQKNLRYSIKKGEISDSSEFEEIGIGIRVIKNGKIGFGYTTPGEEEKAIKRAEELSNISPKLEIDLPEKDAVSKVKTYDNSIENIILEEEGGELSQKVIEGAEQVNEKIIPSRGGVTFISESKVIGNTNDILLKEKHSGVLLGMMVTLPGADTSITASESRYSRKKDLDFLEVGKSAGDKVMSLENKSNIPQKEVPVVLNQDAFSMLLWFGLVPPVNGENVRKGKSIYEGMIGDKVASESVDIIDDPTQDWGPGSGAFDDEGVKSIKNPIIEDGILKNFMYDLKEASKSNTETTGNGTRASFKDQPNISDRNMVVRGRDLSKEKLMPQKGILVDGVMGAHTLNPSSGDFSVVANPAWRIENGEKKGRLEGCMISGNIHEVLKSMELGKDYKKIRTGIGSRSIKMDLPSTRMNDVTISGK